MTSSSTSKPPRKVRRFPGVVSRLLAAIVLLLLLLALAWAVYALAGLRAASQTAGTVRVSGLEGPVRIIRDDRDIPHIVASSERDLMFAQGYAEASDRLFQMDLLRRFVYGRLSEVLGSAVIPADENARIAPVREIIDAQWSRMPASERALVQAFSDGVNAAMTREPLPMEFRLLLYKPERWRPQDSLAVGMATVLDLIDRWDDVIRRDAVARAANVAPLAELYSITDPAYDAPIAPASIRPVAPLSARHSHARAHVAVPSLGLVRRRLRCRKQRMGRRRCALRLEALALGERSASAIRHSGHLVSGRFAQSGAARCRRIARRNTRRDFGPQREHRMGRDQRHGEHRSRVS